MFAPINPEGERIRAQAILRTFTEYENAVDMFAPMSPQGETAEPAANVTHHNGWSIMRVFSAIKLKTHTLWAGLTQSQAGCETC
jgi:hypothetical protein